MERQLYKDDMSPPSGQLSMKSNASTSDLEGPTLKPTFDRFNKAFKNKEDCPDGHPNGSTHPIDARISGSLRR